MFRIDNTRNRKFRIDFPIDINDFFCNISRVCFPRGEYLRVPSEQKIPIILKRCASGTEIA
jgi:hypothetical protein